MELIFLPFKLVLKHSCWRPLAELMHSDSSQLSYSEGYKVLAPGTRIIILQSSES